jgi:hypothetical protein
MRMYKKQNINVLFHSPNRTGIKEKTIIKRQQNRRSV